MSNLPSFAVVLAAYNGTEFILEQIDSIIRQEKVRLHLFINVDKSTDGTEALLYEKFMSHPFITILPFGGAYGGAAPNFFHLLMNIDLKEVDYVSFADQDDIWYPQKLWRAHYMMSENSAMGYSSNVVAFWSDGCEKLINKAQPQRKWDFLFEAAGPGCTYVMHKDLALNLQQFIKNKLHVVQKVELHDWLFYAFARANGYKWIIDSDASMHYRQHDANQVGVNIGWRAFKSRVVKVLAGWGVEQASIIATLLNLGESTFIRRWKLSGRLGLLWLALNANQCRRRRRDRLFFFISCLVLAVMGRTHKR